MKYYILRCKGLEGVPWYEACLKLRKREEIEEVSKVKESEMFRANKILEANKKKMKDLGICLFCDNCENSTDFERLKVIGEFDAKAGQFKKPTKSTVYVRCIQCGSVEPFESKKRD